MECNINGKIVRYQKLSPQKICVQNLVQVKSDKFLKLTQPQLII